MKELRADLRVPLHLHINITTENGRRLRGRTENLSAGGAMLTIAVDPPLVAGEFLSVEFELPRPGESPLSIRRSGCVSWASAVLPDLLGICFDKRLAPEEIALFNNGDDEFLGDPPSPGAD